METRLNPDIARVTNSKTGAVAEVDFSRPVGLIDGAPALVEYDLEAIAGRGERPHIEPAGEGIWRYAPLLPVQGVPDDFGGDVGRTPTVLHERMSEELGVELFIKNEGTNPTGSFKDRGLSVGVALGVATGATRFCLPTQGNAGVAASFFSTRAGLQPALVYMPVGHRGSIYARSAALFGAEVRFFGQNIAEAGKRMREDLADELADGRYVDISTFFEPGRLEGKKTMGLEIFDTFGADALPDHVLYPTGGGTGLVGIWKAFGELVGLGMIAPDARLPHMVAVQSSSCCPVVRSFERGLEHVEPVVSEGTIADGLDVPGAIMGHGILRTLRESDGTAQAVSDRDIVREHRHLGAQGVSACFEGAATVAALRQLIARGQVSKGARVLALDTASHLVSLSSAGAERASQLADS